MAGIFEGYVEFLSASSSAFPNAMTAKGYGDFLLGINKTLEGLRDLPGQDAPASVAEWVADQVAGGPSPMGRALANAADVVFSTALLTTRAARPWSPNTRPLDYSVSGRAPDRGIIANSAAGRARQARVQGRLQGRFKNASVQKDRYLRTADGRIAKDPVTGEGRRVDHVVIENGRAKAVVETTSKTAKKNPQLAKEWRIRQAGGTFIRERQTGALVDVASVPTRTIRVR